jgi:uncharacterized protein YcnI
MTLHHPTAPRRLRRAATVLAAAGAALLVATGTATAHVSITNDSVVPGSYSTVNFRVPNESETAATTSVEIRLPADTPFAFVSAGQAPGWTITTTTTKFDAPVTVGSVTVDEAVTSVTYTADGAGLAPHQFVVFDLLLGPIPDVDQLSFGAVQTYDDGEVVNWTEPTPPGGEEPEHPAPVLVVAGEATDSRHAADSTTPTATATAADGPTTAASDTTHTSDTPDSTDNTARVLGAVGIVTGLAGVGTGVALTRGRQRRPTGQ